MIRKLILWILALVDPYYADLQREGEELKYIDGEILGRILEERGVI